MLFQMHDCNLKKILSLEKKKEEWMNNINWKKNEKMVEKWRKTEEAC